MKRTLLPVVLAMLLLGAFGYGLSRARPDLGPRLVSWWLRIQKGATTPRSEEQTHPKPTPIETADDGWCLAHQAPEAICKQCQDLPEGDRICVERLPVLRLEGPEVAKTIGLETVPVVVTEHTDTLPGNAEIVYDANAYAEIRPRVNGLVRDILTDEGHVHKRGDLLATIDSADVGTAKAQYLSILPLVKLAEATLRRTQELTKANALPLKDELEASTMLNRARADLLNAAQRLRNLGFKDDDLATIEKKKDTSSLLRIVAPIDGTIVARHAVSGEAVEPIHQLFVIADTSKMWAWIDVYEYEIDHVKPDQAVRFRITGMESREFHGRVDWIDTAVNPATRTIRVRAELDNPDGYLRSNQFGRAEIVVGQPHQALLVPKSAVQSVGSFDVVFIPWDDGSYHTQRVVLDEAHDVGPGRVEVKWGLKPDQHVVTTGAFQLLTDLIKKREAMNGGG